MDCKLFFELWKQTCYEKKTEICGAWDSGSYSEYTKVILGKTNNKSVLVELTTKLNEYENKVDFYQEYYSCDAVFFKEENTVKENEIANLLGIDMNKKKAPSTFNQTWIKQIQIHFEHENNIKSSWQEIMQFCAIPGELNVLVTYPNDEDEKKTAIQTYEKLISGSKLKNLLVIFGTHPNENVINWEGYKLANNRTLEKIE